MALPALQWTDSGDTSKTACLECSSTTEEFMSVRQKKQELLEAMHRAREMEPSTFVPNKLLDTLIQRMQLKNDAELCRALEVQPPIISKIRHRKLNVTQTPNRTHH
jgi:hypothetical protein